MNDNEIHTCIDKKVENKLDKKTFYWAMAVITAILSGIIGWGASLATTQTKTTLEISNQLTGIVKDVEYMKSDIADIKSVFKNYDIEVIK